MAINGEWHAKHRMPKNPTLNERAEWHMEHREKCGCRPVPPKILEYIKHRKKAL